MNNTSILPINQDNNIENVVAIDVNENIYDLLLEAEISKDDIIITDICLYVRIEHLPIVSDLCNTYNIWYKELSLSFEELLKSPSYEPFFDEKSISPLPYEPLINIKNRIIAKLKETRQKEILGLNVQSIPSINSEMLGLRGLICLTAAPNCGKTVLTIQLVLDVLENNNDTCAVFVSLDMSVDHMVNRILRHMSELTFQQFNLKTNYNISEKEAEGLKKFDQFEPRMIILGRNDCENLTPKDLISITEDLKNRSGCKRSVVVIDYLQLWQNRSAQLKFNTDLELDKWLMAQMQILQAHFEDDPVVVIAESRKPSNQQGRAWGSEMADLSGSGRFGFGFETIINLFNIDNDQIIELAERHGMSFSSTKSNNDKTHYLANFREYLFRKGVALVYLKVSKGRDGVEKFMDLMAFDYRRNRFTPATSEAFGEFIKKINSFMSK